MSHRKESEIKDDYKWTVILTRHWFRGRLSLYNGVFVASSDIVVQMSTEEVIRVYRIPTSIVLLLLKEDLDSYLIVISGRNLNNFQAISMLIVTQPSYT